MFLTMRKTDQAPDWPKLIDDLMQMDMPLRRIAEAMGLSMVSESMLRHYRNGVQPLWWRGDGLIKLWCEVTRKTRDQIPQVTVTRGRWARRMGKTDAEARAIRVNLPEWPPAANAELKGRKAKRA